MPDLENRNLESRKIDLLSSDPDWTPSKINACFDYLLALTAETKYAVLECLMGREEKEKLPEKANEIFVFIREKLIDLFLEMQILTESEFQSAQEKMNYLNFLLFLQNKLILAKEDPSEVLSMGTKFSLEFIFEKMKNLGVFEHEYYLEFLNEKMQRVNSAMFLVNEGQENHGEIVRVGTRSLFKEIRQEFKMGGNMENIGVNLSCPIYKNALQEARADKLKPIAVSEHTIEVTQADQTLFFEPHITYLGKDRYAQTDLFCIEFVDVSENIRLTQLLEQRIQKEKYLNKSYRRIARETIGKKQELEKEVNKDALTTLFNRRGFDAEFLQELNCSFEYGKKMSLIMLDIDHFKKINDTNGHPAGDEVLRKIGEYLKSRFRKTDVVARYGGEEFAVILKETDLQNAFNLAEEICTGVSSLKIEYEGTEIPVTISLGVAQLKIGSPNEEKQLIARADQALYKAKNQGRNRVCLAEK